MALLHLRIVMEISLQDPSGARRSALVDDEDYAAVSAFHWRIYEKSRPGGGIDGPYAMAHARRMEDGTFRPPEPRGSNELIGGKRTTIRMHKLITGWDRADHRNHNGLDNRRENLRPATFSQNTWNQRKRAGICSSTYKGVTWHKLNKRWMAHIRADKRDYHLGYHDSEREAAEAYDIAARQLHGEFAVLNFPCIPAVRE
jgi:hypothetical protein